MEADSLELTNANWLRMHIMTFTVSEMTDATDIFVYESVVIVSTKLQLMNQI